MLERAIDRVDQLDKEVLLSKEERGLNELERWQRISELLADARRSP